MIRRCLLLGIAAASLTGCVTGSCAGSCGSDGDVVESSRAPAPAWLERAPGVWHEASTQLEHVTIRSQLPDLPLGIKETQQAAIAGSAQALHSEVESQVRARAAAAGIVLAGRSSELSGAVDAVVADTHARSGQIADLFYEQVEGRSAPTVTYRVYVLMTLPRSAVADAVTAVGRRLRQAREPKLRQVGRSLVQS